MMKKLRIGLIVITAILIVINLFRIDFGDLSWSENNGPYGQILGFCILIMGMIYSIQYDKKK